MAYETKTNPTQMILILTMWIVVKHQAIARDERFQGKVLHFNEENFSNEFLHFMILNSAYRWKYIPSTSSHIQKSASTDNTDEIVQVGLQ